MNAFASNSSLFKIFLVALLPIILIFLYSFVWILAYLISKRYFSDIKRNIVISSIVILYMLHPALIRTGLSIFQCVKVSENDSRVRSDLNMKCYSNTHLAW